MDNTTLLAIKEICHCAFWSIVWCALLNNLYEIKNTAKKIVKGFMDDK